MEETMVKKDMSQVLPKTNSKKFPRCEIQKKIVPTFQNEQQPLIRNFKKNSFW